jgi:ribosomal protein S18 acetylase RimI-like enzyme
MQIRSVVKEDLEDLKLVLDSSELFTRDMLEEMISDYLHKPDSAHIWFTIDIDGQAQAIGYCAPEMMTEWTYNLYAIGVHMPLQGQGIGRRMMTYVEKELKSKGQRLLLVETSGLDEYDLTREFYHKCGYTQEARIRDFYTEGEDKIVFWKKL